jgi:glycosyltransferase involved in cell wall biosynthesis
VRATIVAATIERRDAVGNYLVFQARALRDLGYTVRLLVQRTADVPLELVPLVVQVPDPEAFLRGSNPRALEHFRQSAVVLYNFAGLYDLLELISGEASRGVRIFDYHGVTPATLWRGPGRKELELSMGQLRLARHARLGIAHSGFTAEELRRESGLPPERVTTLGYPLSLERFRAADSRARADGDGRLRLLYVGRMARNKRIDKLVEALPHLRAAGLDPQLTLVGDGETAAHALHLREALGRARDLGVLDRISYVGPVPDERLPGYFADCDVYVTASEHEGFCIPVIEAMATGRPVVATAAAALPETVGDGGVLVPAGDERAIAHAIARIARDPGERQAIVERGRRRAETFSVRAQVERLQAVLSGLGLPSTASQPEVTIALTTTATEATPLAQPRCELRLRNDGKVALPEGLEIDASWRSTRGELLASGAALMTLPDELAPGAEVRIPFQVVVPARDGEYDLDAGLHGRRTTLRFRVSGLAGNDPMAGIDRGTVLAMAVAGAVPEYRDFTRSGWLWRMFSRVRAAITRHVVRNHVNLIARRQGEAVARLAEEVRTLRSLGSAERAAHEAERIELAARLERLEREIARGKPGG